MKLFAFCIVWCVGASCIGAIPALLGMFGIYFLVIPTGDKPVTVVYHTTVGGKAETVPKNPWNAFQQAMGGLGYTAAEIRAAYYASGCRHPRCKKYGNQHGKWLKCLDCGTKWDRKEEESCRHTNTKNIGNQHGKWTKCLDCNERWTRRTSWLPVLWE